GGPWRLLHPHWCTKRQRWRFDHRMGGKSAKLAARPAPSPPYPAAVRARRSAGGAFVPPTKTPPDEPTGLELAEAGEDGSGVEARGGARREGRVAGADRLEQQRELGVEVRGLRSRGARVVDAGELGEGVERVAGGADEHGAVADQAVGARGGRARDAAGHGGDR